MGGHRAAPWHMELKAHEAVAHPSFKPTGRSVWPFGGLDWIGLDGMGLVKKK